MLVDLPRDLPIIGHAFDAAGRQVQGRLQAGRGASTSIPWLTFVTAAGFVDRDFFDIFHLVEPGRVKYQYLLSQKTVTLLDKYGLEDPAPTPTPRPRRPRRRRPESDASREDGVAAAGGRRPSGRQIAQPKRPCFSKYFW